MEEAILYSVYVKTDTEDCITAVDSSAFLSDTEGWTLIDRGSGVRFRHAQGNYFPEFLRDERGICRYRLEDGKPVERTQEEMDAEYASLPAPEPSTDDLLLEMAADHEYRLCLIELGVNENDL